MKSSFMFTEYFDQENYFIKLIYTYSKLAQMNNVYCHFVKFFYFSRRGGKQGLSQDPPCPSFWQATSIFDGQKMTILNHFIQF